MAVNYPTSKDTWTRKKNRDLTISEIGDMLDEEDFNTWADWIEALEDTLGLNITGGYSSVKARLDAMTLGATGERISLGIHHINYVSETPSSTSWQDIDTNFILDNTYYAFTGFNVRYRLEGQIIPSVADGGVVMRLYDVTSASAVSGSEVSKTGASGKLYRITTDDLSLVNGHEYKIQIKLPAVDKWAELVRAKIGVYGVKT